MARAAEVYARRQKLSQKVIDYAHAVKVEAMTLLGEFLKIAPKANGGDAQRTRFHKSTESPPTLAQSGIGKKESSAAQALANLKAADPETHEKVRLGTLSVDVLRARVRQRRRRGPRPPRTPPARGS